MEKICPVCKKEFLIKGTYSKIQFSKKIYCSYSCRFKQMRDIKSKICPICNKTFYSGGHTSKRQYCSYKCAGKGRTGMVPWNKGTKGIVGSWNKGRKASIETRIKMSISKQGNKSPAWKGVNAGYGSKHDFIRRIKGKAIKCINCGKENNRIHWSNIDHKYSRNPDDYISLCASCHKQYDLKNKLCKY